MVSVTSAGNGLRSQAPAKEGIVAQHKNFSHHVLRHNLAPSGAKLQVLYLPQCSHLRLDYMELDPDEEALLDKAR